MNDILSFAVFSPQLRLTIALISAILYLLAFCFSFFEKGVRKNVFTRIRSSVWIIATFLNAGIVISNYASNGYTPFVSMYQVLTFLCMTFSLVYLYMWKLHDGDFMKGYFLFFQVVIMTGVFFMGRTSGEWSFPPALNSAYFIPHVLSYMISYTLIAVASLLCIASLFQQNQDRTRSVNGMHRIVLIAFPFSVLGMLLGALWANACWGHFWSFDNKENWSLLTLLSLVMYLHFRHSKKLCKYAKYFVIFAFVLEIITLFFVGMFGGSSNHTYS